jgi:methylenetetrahydromethanopterin dehydrogenase
LAVKIAIMKIGCIGCSPLLEYILDERADRRDITVGVFSPGCKMDAEDVPPVAERVVAYKPGFVVLVSPNAAMPGPKTGRELLSKAGLPVLVISDAPAKKTVPELDAGGFGYIIVEADSMIGARREFLDATEMALFNSDVIRVLAVTGVYRLLYTEIDKIIDQLESGQKITMPKILVDKETATNNGKFNSPYAKGKAMASYEIARRVADLSTQGCFVLKERERYLPMVAAAHEMMRIAAKLADEAREVEKASDSTTRTPHTSEGAVLSKTRLLDKLV